MTNLRIINTLTPEDEYDINQMNIIINNGSDRREFLKERLNSLTLNVDKFKITLTFDVYVQDYMCTYSAYKDFLTDIIWNMNGYALEVKFN